MGSAPGFDSDAALPPRGSDGDGFVAEPGALTAALEASRDPALVARPDGTVVFANSAFVAALCREGAPRPEGAELAALLGPAADDLLAGVAARGSFSGEALATLGDGSPAELEISARGVSDGARAGGRVVVFAADVTAARRLERAATILGSALETRGDGFFDGLAAGLAETLGMEMTLVGRLEQEAPPRVRTLAARLEGDAAAPFTYDLRGAPCERVVGRAPCAFPSGVAALFPEDAILSERGFESYVGVPLAAADGTALGLLAALSARPLYDPPSACRALGLFADRAAAEIERREAREEEARRDEEGRRLVASIPVGLHRYALGADGRLVFAGANPAADAMLGFDHAELVGRTPEEAFPALEGTALPDAYRKAASEGVPWRNEEVSYADGRISGAFLVQAFQTAPGEMAVAFLDVTERRRAEEAIREREVRLERLNRLLRGAARVRDILAEAGESAEAIGRVCAALVEERGYDFAWVGLLDEAGIEVRLVGASGPCDPDLYRIDLRTLEGGTGCGRTAFLRGTAVLVEAGPAEALCAECPVHGLHPGRSALAMPLWRGDRALGVLVVHAAGAEPFDVEETRLVAGLADALAAAVDRHEVEAQRAEIRKERAFRAEVASAALGEESLPELLASLAAAVEQRLGAAGGLVALWDADHGRISLAGGRGSLEGIPAEDEALSRAAARLLDDGRGAGGGPAEGLAGRLPGGAAMAWPLVDGGRPLGVVALEWAAPPSRATLDAAEEACGPLSLSLGKARLIASNRERLATLLALHETGVDLGSSRGRDELLRAIVERAEGLVRGTMAGLYVARADGTLELALASGTLAGFVGTVLASGEGVAGTVARTREPILIDDYRTWPGKAAVYADLGIGSVIGVPVLWRGEVLGSLFVNHEVPGRLGAQDVETVRLFAEQAAVAIANARLIGDLESAAEELSLAYDATLEGWVRALDLRDSETEGHTQRVVERTVALARRAGVPEEELVHVRRGALLHDIGKVGIPDRILQKPGPLTEEEWTVMRLHPTYAHDMLSGIAFLGPALAIPWAHHERWDGTGYPRGLRAGEIPLAARAFAVVDIWDALVSDRPYRKAVPEPEVRAYLRSIAGTHLDPSLVDLFLETESGTGRDDGGSVSASGRSAGG